MRACLSSLNVRSSPQVFIPPEQDVGVICPNQALGRPAQELLWNVFFAGQIEIQRSCCGHFCLMHRPFNPQRQRRGIARKRVSAHASRSLSDHSGFASARFGERRIARGRFQFRWRGHVKFGSEVRALWARERFAAGMQSGEGVVVDFRPDSQRAFNCNNPLHRTCHQRTSAERFL